MTTSSPTSLSNGQNLDKLYEIYDSIHKIYGNDSPVTGSFKIIIDSAERGLYDDYGKLLAAVEYLYFP